MQLEPGERSILAYFPTENKAEEAREVLLQKGYNEIQIDQVSSSPNSKAYGSSSAAALSTMVLGNGAYDRIPSPLMAADPSVSGMAGSYDLPGNSAFLLTIVTDEENFTDALQVLKQHDAQV